MNRRAWWGPIGAIGGGGEEIGFVELERGGGVGVGRGRGDEKGPESIRIEGLIRAVPIHRCPNAPTNWGEDR